MMLYKGKPPITSRIIYLYLLAEYILAPAAPAARRRRKHQHEEHKPKPLQHIGQEHKPRIFTT